VEQPFALSCVERALTHRRTARPGIGRAVQAEVKLRDHRLDDGTPLPRLPVWAAGSRRPHQTTGSDCSGAYRLPLDIV
jgi:hypothetical protein